MATGIVIRHAGKASLGRYAEYNHDAGTTFNPGCKHPVFTAESIDAIYAHTRGIAREVNNVCTACLLDAVVRKEKLVDAIHIARILNEYKDY